MPGDLAEAVTTKAFVFWSNGTVPFYINPKHFDHEQSILIMTTLSVFAFKSCLKFVPALVAPKGFQHVLLFENPTGIRKCILDTEGHSYDEPHKIVLGYECLRSPRIDMVIMRALGFPLEHNRASRDLYIDVQLENVEPGAVQLFMKDLKLPLEWRSLPYDVHSVMHFGERDYSKNGHKTIIFKDHNVKQNRVGLTSLDVRKIELVYGPECRRRDRQEKIELCQNYPGVARKKREVENIRSLRVNPNITPPDTLTAFKNESDEKITEESNDKDDKTVKELGIEEELQRVVDQVYKVSSLALSNAKIKYCNTTKTELRTASDKNNPDILGIIEIVTNYAKNMVEHATTNMTQFCQASDSIESYQRARCSYYGGADRCPQSYRSTKSGPVRYSTQHRPVYAQSTKHDNRDIKISYINIRSGNKSEEVDARRKREVEDKEDEMTEVKVETGEKNSSIHDLRMGTTISMHDKRRRFQEHRFKVKGKRDSGKEDWDSSTVSLENARDRKNKQKRKNKYAREEQIDAEDYREDKQKHYKQYNEDNESENNERKREEIDNESEGYTEQSRRPRKKVDKNRSEYIREERKQKRQKIKEESEELANYNEQKSQLKRLIPKNSEVREDEKRIRTVEMTKKNREFYNERKWRDGIVRYIIKEDPEYDTADMRRRIDEVNSILKRKTCVRLQEITEEDSEKYQDYLVLDTSPDYVTGRVGGRRFGCLELFRGGQHRQHAAMMVMAMLGFYFELARHDRDKYVRVHTRHVRPDKLHHFEKIREDATFALPYDYSSATHPAWQFWRKIGKTGISTVATFKQQDPDGSVMRSLGQNERLLSDLDLVKINSVYGTKCLRRAGIEKSEEIRGEVAEEAKDENIKRKNTRAEDD
ncbi:LOW QUALITY PROTEIN: uncharacterized protein ACR2FA_010557 [Aphomia sociella]